MPDDVLFELTMTEGGVVTISRLPKEVPGKTVEDAVAGVLRTIADALTDGAMRLTTPEAR